MTDQEVMNNLSKNFKNDMITLFASAAEKETDSVKVTITNTKLLAIEIELKFRAWDNGRLVFGDPEEEE
jgi:hypothetical protein